MDEFITAYEDKLKVKRDEIEAELETHLKPFTDKIDEIHQQYLDNYKETLNKYEYWYKITITTLSLQNI